MDKTDIGILKALQEDGRASAQQLSEKVGLSAAPVWRRVKAMEASGVIQGYSAQVDRSKVGLGRSEEHTSELQSLMRISYAVFCLKKKKQKTRVKQNYQTRQENHVNDTRIT